MARTKQTPISQNVDRPVVAAGSDIQSTERRLTPRPTQGKAPNKGGKQPRKHLSKKLLCLGAHQLEELRSLTIIDPRLVALCEICWCQKSTECLIMKYIPLENTHQCNTSTGELRICSISPSVESLPYPSFMDHHSSHFIGRFREAMIDVLAPEGKISLLTSSTIFTISITSRISKLGQPLYILQTSYMHSVSMATKITLLQWHVILKPVHQEKPLTILRGHSQLPHRNSHNQGCMKY